jgi:hypothetical protein
MVCLLFKERPAQLDSLATAALLQLLLLLLLLLFL